MKMGGREYWGTPPNPQQGLCPCTPFVGAKHGANKQVWPTPGARPVCLYSQRWLRRGLLRLVGLFGIAERLACPRPGVVARGLGPPLGLQIPGPPLDDIGVEYQRVPPLPLMSGPA